MFDFKPLAIATGLSWVASYLVHYVPAFESRFVRYVLKQTVAYPPTSAGMRAPTKLIEFERRTTEMEREKLIFQPIEKDVNLFLAKVTPDVLTVLKSLFSSKDDFLLDGMDTIEITASSAGYLAIKYPVAGYDRSIRVDLSTYISLYRKYDHALACALLLFALGVMSSDRMRDGMNALVSGFCRLK